MVTFFVDYIQIIKDMTSKVEGKIESKEVAKELWEIYNVDDFVDAKDNQGDWRVGQIVEKNLNTKMFKVRFDGWGVKYDEPYRFTSPKLAPFRSVVIGYTGQKKNPGIRADWKFTLKAHNEKLETFKQMCTTENKTAWEINQFFRGHNYLYTDFLMTETFQTFEQISAVMEYFLLNVKLVIGYLKTLDPEFKQYYRSQEVAEQSHLVDPESAKVNCFYELMDTLYIVSGSYSRLEGFFSKNSALIRKYLNIDFEKNVRRYYQMRILEEVLKEDGFTILQDLIEKKLPNTKCVIPFLFLKSLSSLYIGLGNQVQYKEKKKYLNLLVEITKINLGKLDDKHLKDINKNHCVDLFDTLKAAYENTDDEQVIRNWTLEAEVKFYAKMILCPYFDKKLKGVTGCHELAEKNKMQPYANQFIKILLEEKFFDCLFSVDNAEIIRKSVEFCKFLYYSQMYPVDISFRIWELRVGKHEAALQQIYSLISMLPSKFAHSQFEKKLFDEISKQPKEQWDQDYIKMIKQFSVTAVGWASAEDKVQEKYGFDILFANVIMKKTDFAITCFIQLLTRFEKTELMTQFINKCFQKIESNQDSYIYTILLLKIIQDNLSELKEASDKNSSSVIKDILNNSNDNLERIAKRFELLAQVTKLTSTNISFEEFMALWNEFHGKPGSKAFHEWILNKKDGQKISINIRIGSDIRKQIFEEIWSEGYDFTNISDKEALLFVQFFKATNISLGKLKKLNVIIKSETLDLIGFDRVWMAFETVQDQKIASSLAQLIVQVHMCPAKIVEDKKQAWTKELISLFSKKIVDTYKLGNLSKVKRLLIIPSKIIDRDEQIFVARPGKSYIMKQYKIVNKTTREQKLIKFNLGGFTYDFKRTVAQKFKVPFKKCKLSCKGEVIKYENYFKSLVECSFSNYPFELEVIEDEAPSIKKCLNSELETFFNLLGDPELERNVWQIIQKLPIAEDELKKLENSEEPWKQINDPSIYKELYRMKAVGFMDRNWWKQFRKGPGFENLSTMFSKVTAKAKVERQYLKALCESIEKCLDIQPSLKQVNPEIFILNLLKSLNQLLQNSAEESPSKKHSVQVSIVSSIFNIFKKIKNEACFLKVLVEKFEDNVGLLSKGLVTVKNQFIRNQFVTKLKEGNLNLSQQSILAYLKIIYEKIFNLATSYHNEQQIHQYFSYASELIDIVEAEEFVKFLKNSDYELTKLVQRGLISQKPELNSDSVNYLLVGYLMLMKRLVKFYTVEERDRITNFLLCKCFFTHLENKNSESLCKGKQSKTAAFDLLASLLVQGKNSQKAIQTLSILHKAAQWRSKKLDDWTLTPGQKVKSASGYVGIKNLGCICYMNSLFQQIFMIPDFRQAILQCEDPLQQKETRIQNVLYQVKKMFFSLLFSDTKYYLPGQFCHAFKNYEGQPTNVYEQMDIDEFSNVLFDRLETQIKGTPHENIIKDFFGGVYANQIVCKGCPHFSTTQQSFLSVSLNVKGKKNIYQSFDTMIKGDTLEGDNAYYCERCSKYVSAVRRVCLKKLPDHLILTLKRFEFDFETMSKLKLNDYCQFPTELNLKEYSQQYLRKQQNPDIFDEDEALPDSYYDYTLQGVVIHIGHADSGHYYSYIKERKNEGRWFEFNDTIVRPFDIKKLAEEAFGGETGTIEVKERIKNAYMLIYERKKKLVDHSKLIDLTRNLAEIPIYANLKQQIQGQNIIQKIENIMFSTEYTKFAANLLKSIDKMQPDYAVEALKYVVQVYLTVIIREKQEISSFDFLKSLNKVLENYSVVREWICTIFTAQKSLLQFLKHNPAKEVRKLLAHWIADIVKGVGSEKKFLFIDNIIANIAISGENNADFCQILFELMEEKSVTQYAAKKHITGILLENILGKQKSLFKNAENFTIVQSAELQIGNEIIIEKTGQESKKIKTLQETAYVWGVLSRVIELAEAQKKKLSELILKEEVDLLYLPINKIYKILEQCKSKFIIKKFCKILTCLAQNNQKFTEEVLNLGYLGLKQYESKRYRQFFILLNRLAKIDDEFIEFRTKKALQNMIKALKDNQKYQFDSSIIQQWIVKSIRKNERFRLLVLKSPDWHKYLLEIANKKIPTEDIFRKNSVFTQTSVNKFHGIKMLRSKKAYELLGKKLETFYVNLSKQQQNLAHEWDSDDDITEQKLQIGQTIGYFDTKDKIEFLQGKVEDILLSRLWISVNKVKMPPIWQDDEKLTSRKYPFEDLESDDEILDSQNTTEMEYDDDLNPVI